MRRDEGVTHLFGKRLKLVEAAFLVTGFKFGKDSFIVGLSGCDDMKENPGKFMGAVFDGFDGTVSCALGAMIVAQVGLIVMKRLSGHPKLLGGAVLGFNFRRTDATAGAGAVLRT